jgi:hypothetical protein
MPAQRVQSGQEFVQTGCNLPVSSSATRPQRPRPALALLAALALGCFTDAARRGRADPGAAPASPPVDLVSDTPWPPAYGDDPLWRRASTGSDFEHARLAQRESAASLLMALRVGGSLGRTALAALPFASDRREVVGPLCELVLGPAPATSSLLLASLYEALSDAPRSEESVDPRADAACASQLRQLAESDSSSPEDRDRALSAITLLAER